MIEGYPWVGGVLLAVGIAGLTYVALWWVEGFVRGFMSEEDDD